jgi:hypothetical protein
MSNFNKSYITALCLSDRFSLKPTKSFENLVFVRGDREMGRLEGWAKYSVKQA